MSEMTIPKDELDHTTPRIRANLQTKFEKFLAEGGAGRSNTNELLAAIVHELVLAKLNCEDKKRSSTK